MPEWFCAHCGSPASMLGHWLAGFHMNGMFHRFPNGRGAHACSPEYSALCRRYFGDTHGFEEAWERFRKYRPEVDK